jgi:hypothetical protein
MSLRTTTVVGFFFIAPVCIAQAPIDTLARLATVNQQYLRIGATEGESVWPRFRPDTIPLVFVLPDRGSVLFNWRGTLPEGFQPVSRVAGGAWKNQRDLGAASTGTSLGGRAAAQVVVSSLDPAALLPTAMHEAFHVFESASIRPGRRFGRGENSFYVSSYPVFDLENEKLFSLEGRILQSALAARSPGRKRELARQFVAVRRTRHRLLDPNFAEFDRASELNEGLAEYALVRALVAMSGDPQLPENWRVSARRKLAEHDASLGSVTKNVTQSLRLRFYSTGPAQALLLDEIAGPTWKRRFMERNETLTDALAGASGIDEAEQRAFLLALRSADTARAEAEAAAGVARLRAVRASQVDSILGRAGILLELSASELPSKDFGFCGFDPQNHLQVSPTVQIQTRWWRPCAGAALSSEFNVPSVHDDERGTVRAVIGLESEVKITVDGQQIALSDGQTIDAAKDVRLDSPRANVQSARARLSREGRTIRITPLPL